MEEAMLKRYKILGAVLALGEFSVSDLASLSRLPGADVRYILRKNSDYVEQVERLSTGRPGGQPILWRIRPGSRERLRGLLRQMEWVGAAPWFGERQDEAMLAELIAVDDVLLRVLPATIDSEERADLIKLARAQLDAATAVISTAPSTNYAHASRAQRRDHDRLVFAEKLFDMTQMEQSLREEAEQSNEKINDFDETEPTSDISYAAQEDAQLVAAVATGDPGEPIAELYRRYAERLYRFGYQLFGDSGLAEEMVQESFVRLWRTADRFDGERGSVSGYLFVIARSVAADLARRPSSRPLARVEDPEVPSQPDSVDQILDGLMVREAIDSLSPKYREVLYLTYSEGLTQSQIADRLGLALGTVKTRLFHGIHELRSVLADRGYSGP